MRVFVLCTGRCGSVTFARACSFIRNYTVGHESRWGRFGMDRLDYPENHIEVDNRLVWYLGLIDRIYGNEAFYVHLTRSRQHVIESFAQRHHRELMAGWRAIIDMEMSGTPQQRAAEYVDCATAAIQSFLKDKPYWVPVPIEDAKCGFTRMCSVINASVDEVGAWSTLARRHNQGLEGLDDPEAGPPWSQN